MDACCERIANLLSQGGQSSPRSLAKLVEKIRLPRDRRARDRVGYTAHIARRGVDQSKRRKVPGYRARRWVVERTNSWMNRFRRLLIRWEKKRKNCLAMIHLACAWITYRQAGIIG